MRKIASMVLLAAGLLLISSQASATETKRRVRSTRPAVQVVKMDPISAHPQKPVVAVEIARRHLRSSHELAGPRLVERIGQGLHRRPF